MGLGFLPYSSPFLAMKGIGHFLLVAFVNIPTHVRDWQTEKHGTNVRVNRLLSSTPVSRFVYASSTTLFQNAKHMYSNPAR